MRLSQRFSNMMTALTVRGIKACCSGGQSTSSLGFICIGGFGEARNGNAHLANEMIAPANEHLGAAMKYGIG